MDLRAALSQCPIAAILRGVKPDEIDGIGDALVEAGVTVIEVPLNSPQPFASIQKLAARHAHHALVGAGTVLNAADVARVKEAGGRLIIAPNFDADVVRAAKAAGLVSLARRDDAVGRLRGAEGRRRRAEAFSRRDHPARRVQGLARGLPGGRTDARGRRGRRGQHRRLSRMPARPATGSARRSTNRGARQPKSAGWRARWSQPQRLDFQGLLPHIQFQEGEASRSANVAREVYCFWGGSTRKDDDEEQSYRPYPAHIPSRPRRRCHTLPGELGCGLGARTRPDCRHREFRGRSQWHRRASADRMSLFRALAVSSGALSPIARPDLTNTSPVVEIGPFPQWSEPGRIVSLDPWGSYRPSSRL